MSMPPTSSDQTLLSLVDRAIRTVLDATGRPILPTTTLIGDLGAESIDLLDISCEIEKQIEMDVDLRRVFDRKQAPSGAVPLDISVQDIIEYVKGRTQ
jgi:acyl carrier protein